MNNDRLIRSPNEINEPAKEMKVPLRVNVDILKQRLIQEKRKEKVKRALILSSVVVSLGALTFLTY
tara:strand:- start:236 stop:433 length:198 start_codon:yes stop_codon:yes gene_type:complete